MKSFWLHLRPVLIKAENREEAIEKIRESRIEDIEVDEIELDEDWAE